MLKFVDLGVDFAGDARVAVADRDGQDAAEEIKILAAFDVPDVLHFGVVGDEGFLVVVSDGRPDVFFVFGDGFFAAGHR